MSRVLLASCGLVFTLLLILFLMFHHTHAGSMHSMWSDDDIAVLRSLRFSTQDVADKNRSNELLFREDAIELGRRLFHDTGLSGSGKVACASCHRPEDGYQDTQSITYQLDPDAMHRAPGLLGVALQDWFFWDGRADSLWSQALVVIESPMEMASSRLYAVRHLCTQYGGNFSELLQSCRGVDLSAVPVHASPRVADENWRNLGAEQRDKINKLFVVIGKSIAAFEAGLMPPISRFDLYVDALVEGNHARAATLLDEKELAGLKLFLNTQITGCINCHNGPMFSSSGFFAVATDTPGKPEHDRQRGVGILLDSEFNCLKWDEGDSGGCPKLQYIKNDPAETTGAYKVPSLRNLRHAPAFMHDGSLPNLGAVIEHYRTPAIFPLRHIDIRPAAMLPHQREQLLAFLNVLGTGVSRQEPQ
jgi:cytochrome c peroxidase